MRRWFSLCVLSLFAAGALHATSHCYKQRSNCFVQEDGKNDVKMYIKRDKFTKVAQKHGLSKERIERMIKKGEGYEDRRRDDREDLRDSHGYYGGVYWPHPIYAYPPYYWDDHPYHDHPHHGDRPEHPDRPGHGKPPKNPVTIQPTENPFFDRPHGGGPSTQPVQRPSTKPVQRPTQRPAVRPTRPTRPAARPRPRPRPTPRPRPRPRSIRRGR